MKIKYLLILVVLLVPFIGYAQVVPPPIPPPPPPGLPIDGFEVILIALGVFLGVFKIFKDSSS
ncbi:hypothetical protein [uncultured Polaribacter sp.]|uniref:hypothetical protein n=1 Tax=uncultured Polaribacter sp. TaxID=174711 RepID=UPI002617001F|nr:hypothetical protein [uncultured Polaribacter sp.]